MARRQPTWTDPPRRSARTWLRSQFNLTPRTIDGWNDLTRRMEPPGGIIQQFAQRHAQIPADRTPLVWEALLQWVRIRGRHEVSLCQPSLAVDDLWRQLVHDERGWSQLPERVRMMNRIPVRDHNARDALADTHVQAHWDEFSASLPLLFLVDELLDIPDGRLYRAECRAESCSDLPGQHQEAEPIRTCLHGIPWFPIGSGQGAAP